MAVWTLYDSWQTLSSGGARAHNILSVMIMTAALCVQSFSEMAMKRKMTAGDEEYKESNKILRAVIIIIATAAVILSFGSYLILKLN